MSLQAKFVNMNFDNTMDKIKNEDQSILHIPAPFAPTYFHGTKADLKIGDFIQVGFTSNYENRKLKHMYVAGPLAVYQVILGDGSKGP